MSRAVSEYSFSVYKGGGVMKELFVQLAKYNGQANDQLIAAIEDAPEGMLTRPVGSYFYTALGLLNHLLQCLTLCLC